MSRKPATPEPTTIVLKNGAEEVEPLVRALMMSLRQLMREHPIVFYELVHLCRDRNHRLFVDAREVLDSFTLLERNGFPHDSVRNVVLSAVEGEGLDMVFTSPIAE